MTSSPHVSFKRVMKWINTLPDDELPSVARTMYRDDYVSSQDIIDYCMKMEALITLRLIVQSKEIVRVISKYLPGSITNAKKHKKLKEAYTSMLSKKKSVEDIMVVHVGDHGWISLREFKTRNENMTAEECKESSAFVEIII